MKFIYLSVLTIGLFACSNNSAANNESENQTKPQIPSESVDESKDKSLANLKIEDYIKVKSRAEIEKIFGKDNMKEGESFYAEGTVKMNHSEVTNPENGQIIKYLYEDDNKTVSSIEFAYHLYDKEYNKVGTQKIESENGLYTGMSIKDLSEWNEGEEINFSGFGWDFHGNVYQGEKYLNPDSKLAKSGFSFQMDQKGDLTEKEFLGDVTLSSENKKVLNSDIVLGMITVYFTNDDFQSEDSEAIYYMSMEFDEFFEAFQAAVKNKDVETLKKLSDIGKETNVDINELTNKFDGVFSKEVKDKILSTKPSQLKDVKIPNGKQGKELNSYVEYHEDGNVYESSTFFYFQNTDAGWKLVSVIIAG